MLLLLIGLLFDDYNQGVMHTEKGKFIHTSKVEKIDNVYYYTYTVMAEFDMKLEWEYLPEIGYNNILFMEKGKTYEFKTSSKIEPYRRLRKCLLFLGGEPIKSHTALLIPNPKYVENWK